jgi:dTDP-4-dehydrorhamnose 3,5-epimerase
VIFSETFLKGAFVLELDKREDERGYFARTFCQHEFEAHGLNPRVAQCNISFNRRNGTLRGLHWQAPPYEEAKLVACIRGAIYDVIVDLRADSPTYMRHFATELSAANRRMVYVPEGFAHGFQTLQDDTDVSYQMSQIFSPQHARGARWDDPAFAISWPPAERIIAERDQNYPLFPQKLVSRP